MLVPLSLQPSCLFCSVLHSVIFFLYFLSSIIGRQCEQKARYRDEGRKEIKKNERKIIITETNKHTQNVLFINRSKKENVISFGANNKR
jgi:hypothetical protein